MQGEQARENSAPFFEMDHTPTGGLSQQFIDAPVTNL